MLVKGSINYSPCGRKRSVKRKKKVQRPPSTLKTNAYNKGAYQVISKDNIKDIGK